MTALIVLFLTALAALTLIVAASAWFAFMTRQISARAERLVPPCGQFVEIGGNRIHYVDTGGAGRPILFIHGLGGHLHHLRHPLFHRFGDDFRLVSLDRAGSGYSTRRSSLTGRLPEQADLIVKFIEALKLDRPLLVGHSLGGAVALSVALDHPGRISGLALIAPLTHQLGDLPQFGNLKIRSALLRRFLSSTVAVPMSVRHAQQTRAIIFGPQEPPPDYAIEGAALSMLRPSHFYAAATDYVALDHDLPHQETRYGEIRMPVGILFGAEDRVLDYRMQGLQMEGKLVGLDLEIIEGVGHMPQYAVADRVIAFIRRTAGKAFAA